MPLYEYQCESCRKRFERIQRFTDPPVESCPACGGPVRKLLSSPAIQFKGSGWYITDYAKKGAAETAKTDGAGEAKPGQKDKKAEKPVSSESSSSTKASESKAPKTE
jgi:putative FmdB family regulatory protein